MRKYLPQGLMLALFSLLLAACASQQQLAVVSEPEPTVEYLSGDGVYTVASYTKVPSVEEYSQATIYYPANKTEPFGAVAISPGFTQGQEDMSWWGPRLASHGFAVLTLDTNERRDYPHLRAKALIAAIEVLRGENSREGSPLKGRLDTDKMAIMGHSMGGGGTLLAAHEHSDKIRAAIPFTPWQPNPDFSGVTVPTLIIAGEADRIAKVAEHAWPHYNAIPDSTTKVFLEFKDGNHFIGNTTRSNLDLHAQVGRYAIAWLKLYVDGDSRYQRFIYGDVPQQVDKDVISRFLINQP